MKRTAIALLLLAAATLSASARVANATCYVKRQCTAQNPCNVYYDGTPEGPCNTTPRWVTAYDGQGCSNIDAAPGADICFQNGYWEYLSGLELCLMVAEADLIHLGCCSVPCPFEDEICQPD